MIAQTTPNAENNFLRHISEQIEYRTWRRVRDLQVKIHDGQLVVEGKTPSYYVKQLALRAICDAVGTTPFAINIEVEHNQQPHQLHEALV
jgi:hypothetical protein